MDDVNGHSHGEETMRELTRSNLESSLSAQLDAIRQDVKAIAQEQRTDTLALLALLRTLEEIHVDIRDTLFQPSLPNNRQKLYALLRDIELDGGWPYIPRMKLRRLMANFSEKNDEEWLKTDKGQ